MHPSAAWLPAGALMDVDRSDAGWALTWSFASHPPHWFRSRKWHAQPLWCWAACSDARFWQALANPRHPAPKFARPAAHIEVNKGLQVLYVVRGSKIALIVPISTAGIAGAFTPVGRFAVYRKVGGFDPSPLGTLYDPLYFTGGYAIHGNPSVPPYPASHGCVRVPMWVAPQLYRTIPYGETVYVY